MSAGTGTESVLFSGTYLASSVGGVHRQHSDRGREIFRNEISISGVQRGCNLGAGNRWTRMLGVLRVVLGDLGGGQKYQVNS